jgi:alpha-L-fucosidase
VPPVFEERLRQMGYWLSINGEAIYKSKAWKFQNDTTNPDVWYTTDLSNNAVYAILLKYPTDTKKVLLTAPSVSEATDISLLGYANKLQWVIVPQGGMQGHFNLNVYTFISFDRKILSKTLDLTIE